MFAKDISVLTNTDAGKNLGKIATGITFLFGAMAIWIGVFGFAVGCCFTRCQKCAKICSCFVSNHYSGIRSKLGVTLL